MQYLSNPPHVPPETLSTNQKLIYQYVRLQERVSRADIVRYTRLTFPSVSRIVGELLEGGYVREADYRRGGLGKPALELEVQPDHLFGLGLYLEPQRAQLMLMNAAGEPVARHKLSGSTRDPEALLERLLATFDVPWPSVAGIGVVFQGTAPSAEALDGVSARLNLPIFSDSLAGAGIRFERYFGPGADLGRFLYLDASQRVLGAMIDETILAGPNLLEQLTKIFAQEAATDGADELGRWVLALRSAAALTEPEALIAAGLKREDRNALGKALAASGIDLKVLAGKSALHGPALTAACLPLYESLRAPCGGAGENTPAGSDGVGLS